MDVAFAILYLTNDILLYHSFLLPYSLRRNLLCDERNSDTLFVDLFS